jgi:hypothetical protein
MLELGDIQHIVVARVPALTGRYEFLSFRQAAQGRAWLAGILDKAKPAAGALAWLWFSRRGSAVRARPVRRVLLDALRSSGPTDRNAAVRDDRS